MDQKGSIPMLLIIILVIVGLIFVYIHYNKLSTSNSVDVYQDLKVSLRKSFEK